MDGPLCIGLVVRPAAGGMRRHIQALACGLDRNRFRVTIFRPPRPDLDPDGRHAQVIPIPLTDRVSLRADTATIRIIRAWARENRVILHAHGLRAGMVTACAAVRRSAPYVVTLHNLARPDSAAQRALMLLFGRGAATIIAVSQSVADSALRAGVNPARLRVIANGVDLGRFTDLPDRGATRARYGLPLDAPIVLAVGRLTREKGFAVLIEAFGRLQAAYPGARLVVVGDGPEAEKLRRLCEGTPACVFTGAVREPAPLFAASDVVAIPSLREGQGMVALEAMAAARPVAASAVGGLAETVTDGETGLLVDRGEAAAWALALETLLRDPDLRDRMGSAGRRRVEQRYTERAMVRAVEAVYVDAAQIAGWRSGT